MTLHKAVAGMIALLAGLGAALAAEPLVVRPPLGLIEPDLPLNRPLTKELVELGRLLFFDRRLSGTGETSCATCHNPAFAFAEPRAVSISDNGQPQKRNAPSLLNVGYLPTLMWDGRFRTLEEQALDPFRVDGDMGLDVEGAMRIVRSDTRYAGLFQAALGAPPSSQGFAYALAAFQRTLVSGGSPFDRYLFAEDASALSELQLKGLDVFATKAGCLNCHDVFHPRFNPLGGGVALFTDFRFHNLGVGYAAGRMSDSGRYYTSRTPDTWGAFRTPSLRNVELTAPYMHDGSLATLDAVVDFYNQGGRANPSLSPSIHPLLLSKPEQKALIEFLKALTDPRIKTLALEAGQLQ